MNKRLKMSKLTQFPNITNICFKIISIHKLTSLGNVLISKVKKV